MSKIAIISQPDQGVLIDVGGCHTLQEAASHLTSTLQVSSQFWKGTSVAINLGTLELTPTQVSQLLAIAKGVGASPRQVFSENEPTRASLRSLKMPIGKGKPMTLPRVELDALDQHDLEEEGVAGNSTSSDRDRLQETISFLEEDESLNILDVQDQDDLEASVDDDATGDLLEDESVDESEIEITEAEFSFVDEDDAISFRPDEATEEIVLRRRITDQNKRKLAAEVERIAPPKMQAPPVPATLYLHQTLRSGQTVSHKGHLVIIGDVNPGAEVMADGDVTVWGALRGIAHAGIGGNLEAEIRALKLQPIQIRIAHAIARSPDRPRVKFSLAAGSGPETARIIDGKIKIAKNNID